VRYKPGLNVNILSKREQFYQWRLSIPQLMCGDRSPSQGLDLNQSSTTRLSHQIPLLSHELCEERKLQAKIIPGKGFKA